MIGDNHLIGTSLQKLVRVNQIVWWAYTDADLTEQLEGDKLFRLYFADVTGKEHYSKRTFDTAEEAGEWLVNYLTEANA